MVIPNVASATEGGPAGVDSARVPLEQSLREEQRMAEWVESNVEKVTMECRDVGEKTLGTRAL